MAKLYLSKDVTIPTTGAVVTAWVIGDYFTSNNPDPTKITFRVNLCGYVSPATLVGNLKPIIGTRYTYNLNAANFPAGTDLTAVTQNDLYTAVAAYLASPAGSKDDLSSAIVAYTS